MPATAGPGLRLQDGRDQQSAPDKAEPGRGQGDDAGQQERLSPVRCRRARSDRPAPAGGRESAGGRPEGALPSPVSGVEARLRHPDARRSPVQGVLGRRACDAGDAFAG